MTLSVSLSRTEVLEELTGSHQSQCIAEPVLLAFPVASALPGGDGVGKVLTVQHSGPKCDPQNSHKKAQITASDPALRSRSLGLAGQSALPNWQDPGPKETLP